MLGYTMDLQVPVFTSKYSFDSSLYLFDFSNAVQPGDSIVTIASIVSNPPGLTIGVGSIVSGVGGPALAVQSRLSSGAPGVLYTILVSITTLTGDQFARAANLQVQ